MARLVPLLELGQGPGLPIGAVFDKGRRELTYMFCRSIDFFIEGGVDVDPIVRILLGRVKKVQVGDLIRLQLVHQQMFGIVEMEL